MLGVNARRLLLNATALSLALGLSVFATAQDTPAQPSGSGTASSGKMSKKSNKKSGAAASSDKSAAGASSVPAADKMFIKKAAQGGMSEVELGKMAAEKGSSDAVKQFGQKMADEHSKANEELKALAEQKGVKLPAETNAAGKAMKAKLDKLSGEQFDKAYAMHMVKDHTNDVAEFKKEASSGKDPEVKAWAEKTVPTLEGHLQMAKENAKQVGGASKPAKSSKKAASETDAK